MAKRYRLSFFFSEPKQGWSENWVFERDATPLSTLIIGFNNLALARAALLGSGAILEHIRVSEMLDLGTQVKAFRKFKGKDLMYESDTTRKLAAPHDSLLVRCTDATGDFQKVVYLGGAWMQNFDALRHYKAVGDYDNRLATWVAQIKAQGLGWMAQAKDQDRSITGYTVDPLSGRTTYTLDGPITMLGTPPVRRVVVEFPGEHHALDGVQLVAPVDNAPNSVVTVRPRAAGAFNGIRGSMKDYTYSFVSLADVGQGLADISAERMARRARGKASYAEAGRAKARIRG